MTTYSWISETGGSFDDQTNWYNDTDNMSDDGFPGPGDTAFLDASSAVTVSGNTVANLHAFATDIIGSINVTDDLFAGVLSGGDDTVGTALSTIFNGISLTGGTFESCEFNSGTVKAKVLVDDIVDGAIVTAQSIERDPSGQYLSSSDVAVDSGSLNAVTMTLVGPTAQIPDADSFYIGAGTATITGAASATGKGTLIEADGGTLKFEKTLTIDEGAEFDAGDDVTTAVAGNYFAAWDAISNATSVTVVSVDVNIGVTGPGTLLVRGGAIYDAAENAVTLAVEAGSTATLTVTDEGSVLQAGSLTIARAGTASPTTAQPTLGATVSLGGAIQVTNNLTIGEEAGGNGRLLVADSASLLQVGGNATLGASGTGALVMTGGIATINGATTVGLEKGSTGRLTVSAASLKITGKLTIADAGAGTAIVQLGASLNAGDIAIGGVLGAKGSLSLNGSLTDVTTDDLTVGAGGTGSLSVTNGAALKTSGVATIGSVALGAIVSASLNTGGSWVAANALTVGGSGGATLAIAGQKTSLEVDGVMTIGANAGGVVTLGTNTAASAATLEWGRSLIVGEQAKGALTINAGDSARAIAGAVGALYIATEAGSSGTVSVVGAGAQLTGESLEVGGTAAAAGGAGTLAVGAGAEASFAGATVWNTGKITDAGTLTLGGVVHGTGNLLIESGGTLTLKRSDASARPVFVAGAEAETLDLVAGQLPAAHIAGFAANDLVSISGLATSDKITTTYASTTAIVDFLALGKVVGHLDFAMSAGQHDVFQFNAATGALTLAPSS